MKRFLLRYGTSLAIGFVVLFLLKTAVGFVEDALETDFPHRVTLFIVIFASTMVALAISAKIGSYFDD